MRIKKIASFNVKEGVKSVRYSDLNSGIQYLPADGIINIKSEKVRIAGFGVNESSLYKIDVNGTPYSIGSANSIYLSNAGIITSRSIGGSKGTLSWAMAISDKFGVTVDGTLYAMGGHFAGTIEAKSGKIGTTLINEDGSIVSANGGFRLDANGDLTISHVGGSQLVQDAQTALSTANTAVANAKTAQTAASNAQSRATTLEQWRTNTVDSRLNHAYNVVNHWAQDATSDSTTINGGLIQTNTITADKIAIGDFTNYCQLSPNNLYGSTYSTTEDFNGSTYTGYVFGHFGRDTHISNRFPCKKGDRFRVTYKLKCNITAKDKNGNNVANVFPQISIFTYKADGTSSNYYIPRNHSVACGTYYSTEVSEIITLTRDSDCYFDVWIQIEALKDFSGWFTIIDPVVQRMTTGELIVDGAITAEKISANAITADKITTNDIVGTNGRINLRTGTFDYGNGKLKWDGSNLTVNGNGSFSGDITATSGKIASFTIRGKYLESSDEEVGMSAGDTSFWAGWNSSDGSYKFKVTKDGALTANNATLKGSITSVGSDNTKIDISNGKIFFYKNNSDNDYTSVIKGLTYAVNPDTEAMVSGSTTLIGVKSDNGMIVLSTDYKKDVDRFASNILISKRKVRASVRSNDDTHVSMLNTEPFNEKMSIYEKNTDADKATKGSMNYDKMAMIRLTKANNAYQVIIRADDIFVSKLSEAPARYTVEADKKVTAHYTMTKIEEYIAEYVYPVGALYISVDFRDPSEVLGFGTWDPIEDKFLLGGSKVYIWIRTA